MIIDCVLLLVGKFVLVLGQLFGMDKPDSASSLAGINRNGVTIWADRTCLLTPEFSYLPGVGQTCL